ncbi:MAG: DNA polymerase III subunit chi [Rhodospirillales bacterium]|nr:DNA polymerase III subunit chi [Alphaproteobacteria bacterium]MBL6947492.1 DNA polymerase III subunit chi [Rhodospirillales bacterium]
MTDIAFYHLQSVPLERALPKLLEKTLDAGKRALVLAGSQERVEALNGQLWTYAPDSWLPHGSIKDGEAEEQPVWLSTDDDNPNGAQFLFLTDGATSERVAEFERCFEIFNGREPAAVEAARERWKAYSEAGHDLTYWRQTDSGGWEKKEG